MGKTSDIFKLFSKTERTLVFTSETVARNYIEAFIRHNPGKAIFLDRAISWDKFRERLTDTKGRKPADDLSRKVFVHGLDLKVFSSLRHFASPDYPESKESFSRLIARNLPYMTIDEAGIPSDILFDMQVLKPLYEAFLQDHGLYEPLYEKPDLQRLEKDSYVLVYPETFSDNLVQEVLATGKVAAVPIGEETPEPLHVYKNAISEIRDVVRRIEELRKTVPEEEIAITSPSLDTYRPYLEYEASIRGIGLNFTSRKPFVSYPEGRFFIVLEKAMAEGWSVENIREFLLDPAYPYKEREAILHFASKVVSKKLVSGDTGEMWGKMHGSLKEEEISYLATTFHLAQAIFRSESPKDLAANIRKFRDMAFEEDAWNENDNRLLGSILDIAASLEDKKVERNAFSLFMSVLKDKTYVENDKKAPGVKVYSYPASCGLVANHHFVLGLDDKNTRKILDEHPYLSKEDKLEDKDIGNDVLKLYGSTLGTNPPYLTGTTEGFDGARLIPTLFLDNFIEEKEIRKDFIFSEPTLWDGEEAKMLPSERISESYAAAKDSILSFESEDEVIPTQGVRTASVSKVKDFDKCLYRGFVSTLLGISRKDFDVVIEDSFELGNILHAAVQECLGESGSLGAIDRDELSDKLREKIHEFRRKGKLPTDAVANQIEAEFREKIKSVLENNKSEHFNDLDLVANEIPIKGYRLGEHLSVEGRIDTLLKDKDDNYAILDYKTDTKYEYKAKSLKDTSLQVILYALMMEDENTEKNIETKLPDGTKSYDPIPPGNVAKGSFYSFKEETFHVVWPNVTYMSGSKTFNEGNDYFTVRKDAEERLKTIVDAVEEGTFVKEKSADSCKGCPYKRICRERYIAK